MSDAADERLIVFERTLTSHQAHLFKQIMADLTARLASAEGKYEAQREQADFHAREALRFKAAVEQARDWASEIRGHLHSGNLSMADTRAAQIAVLTSAS